MGRLAAGAAASFIAAGLALSKSQKAAGQGPTGCSDDLSHELYAEEQRTVALFETCSKSVVHINTFKDSLVYDRRRLSMQEIPVQAGTGSGFVWDEDHIVTNFHVINNADRATVVLSDGTSCEATLVGLEPDRDLAVLKVDRGPKKLIPLARGRSNNLHVGQRVFAIGNPFGLDQTLTSGIVSGLSREMQSISGWPMRDLIQTDAAINPGNSGGPLLDSRGRLIGVNTMIASPSGAFAGVGFAIPVNTVIRVVSQLVKYGHTKRAFLGVHYPSPVQYKKVSDILTGTHNAPLQGALVWSVEDGSPADLAGVKSSAWHPDGLVIGDEILQVNGKKITSSDDLVDAIEAQEVGDTVEIMFRRRELMRSGSRGHLKLNDFVQKVKLAERPTRHVMPGRYRGGTTRETPKGHSLVVDSPGDVRSRL